MFKKFFIFILVFSILVCSFSFAVSAAYISPSIDVFKVSSGYSSNGTSVPFSYSGNTLSFDRPPSSFVWVFFNFLGIDSSELLNGSFSFTVTYNSLLSTSPNYYGLYGFNGVSYQSIGSILVLGNRADFLIDSGILLSDYDHFSFRCNLSTLPSGNCSFTFSDLFVNVYSNPFEDFLSDISSFFSSILSFIVSILSFIFNSPLFYLYSFIFIIFVLYFFYRVKRHE